MILGHTDLWISQSRAKFDEEADFEVCSAVAPQKRHQTRKKRKFRSKIFANKNFSASKNETSEIVRNAFWQSFVAIRAMFEELRKNFHLNPPTGIKYTASFLVDIISDPPLEKSVLIFRRIDDQLGEAAVLSGLGSRCFGPTKP